MFSPLKPHREPTRLASSRSPRQAAQRVRLLWGLGSHAETCRVTVNVPCDQERWTTTRLEGSSRNIWPYVPRQLIPYNPSSSLSKACGEKATCSGGQFIVSPGASVSGRDRQDSRGRRCLSCEKPQLTFSQNGPDGPSFSSPHGLQSSSRSVDSNPVWSIKRSQGYINERESQGFSGPLTEAVEAHIIKLVVGVERREAGGWG